MGTQKGNHPLNETMPQTNHVSRYFKQRREEKGLTRAQLAQLVGYRNISKGCRRLAEFEETGAVHPDLFGKLTAALAIDEATVKHLLEGDYRSWNKWANQPIRPYLVIHLIAAVYNTIGLPEHICSVAEAERFASITAKRYRMRCCLVLSRRISVWYATDGSIEKTTEAVPGEPNTPIMRIKGSKPFLLKTLDHGIAIQQVEWPKKSGP